MDAMVFDLDAMRLRRSSPTNTAESFRLPLVSDGLALLVSATSFWAEYAIAMASFHHLLIVTGSSPCSKLPKSSDPQ